MTATDASGVTALLNTIVRELIDRSPELGTELGDHRQDHLLEDRSPGALEDRSRWLARRQADLAALGTCEPERHDGVPAPGAPSVNEVVDASILATSLEGLRLRSEDIAEHTWNPLVANPGNALYLLLTRDFAPLPDRLASLAGRLDAVPQALATARETLERMPRVHLETAIGQFTGTRTLLATEVPGALRLAENLRNVVEPAAERAVDALDEHLAWLEDQRESADREPRLGAELYGRKLAVTLDTDLGPAEVLHQAEATLDAVAERLEETAARLDDGPADGRVRRVLGRLAAEGEITDATILASCEEALAATRQFVLDENLVTVPDADIRIVVMPEIHRGVAVAYCDPPGPLETRALPTYFAVSPTPSDWDEHRVRSFYREYNAYMLENLTVHEAMPGHVVQLAHDHAYRSESLVRKACFSHSFIEGWAVYAEEMMTAAGYAGSGGDASLSIRMQQLKMQLRLCINAILDVRVHAHGMTEQEGMRLMMRRGHQEEGEAAGKWRRALLTSGQLSTYFVGYTETRGLAADLAQARPRLSVRERHDAMLAHGSPPPRHLRTLLGLGRASR